MGDLHPPAKSSQPRAAKLGLERELPCELSKGDVWATRVWVGRSLVVLQARTYMLL
jgi:hypothetical protein